MLQEQRKDFAWLSSPRVFFGASILIVLVFFGRVIFTDLTYYVSDCHAYLHPMKTFMVESFRQGQFPLWDPYPLGGYSFAGSFATGVFSPLHLLYLVLPFEYAFKIIIVLHHVIAAAFMFIFLSTWKLNLIARAAGSVLFALSSFMLSQTDYFVPATGWIPLILYFYHRSLVHQRFSHAALTGVAIAFAFCQRDLQTIFGIAFLLPAYALVLRPSLRGDIPFSQYFRFVWRSYILTGGFALGMSAVALLPAIQTFASSNRYGGLSLEEASKKSLGVSRLSETVHFASFNELNDLNTREFFNVGDPFVRRIFLGIIPMFLLAFAFRNVTRRTIFIACCLILTFLLALGKSGGIFYIFWYIIPGFSIFRYPEKWLGFFTFFFTIGAALGLQSFHTEKARKLHRLEGWTPALFVSFIVMALLWLGMSSTGPRFYSGTSAQVTSMRLMGFLYAFIIIIGFAVLLVLAVLRKLRVRRMLPILAVACLVELFVFQYRAIEPDLIRESVYTKAYPVGLDIMSKNPSARLLREPMESYIENETFQTSHQKAGYSDLRIQTEGWRRTYRGNIGSEYKVRTVHGLTSYNRPEEKIFWETAKNNNMTSLAADLYSASFILARTDNPGLADKTRYSPLKSYDNELTIWSNSQALPRAYCVTGVTVKSEMKLAALHIFSPSFKPREEVVLISEDRGAEISSVKKPPKAFIIDDEPRYVGIEIMGADSDSYLVLTDSYASGWSATVDGVSAPIYQANMLFRAVRIPPGTKKVEFRFNPPAFYIGLIISILSTLAAAGVIFILIKREKIVQRKKTEKRLLELAKAED